jgi:glycosyltransferase involved in cell wall biosynthesis
VRDLEPLYRSAGIFIVPLRAGSGIRVKILEAMARGIPIVSTSVGVEGLDVTPGEHLLVADDHTDFAQAIRWLLEEPIRRGRMAAAARERALAYDWRTCLQPLLRAYEDLDRRRALESTRAPAASGLYDEEDGHPERQAHGISRQPPANP